MGNRAAVCVVQPVACLLRNMLYGWGAHCSTQFHTPSPFSLSLSLPPSLRPSLSSRAQDKTSSPHLTTNPLPLFLSGSRPSEEQGECGGNETQAVLSLYGKLMPIRSQRLKTVCLVPVSEHLHQLSVCGSALEILDEVQQSNPVN